MLIFKHNKIGDMKMKKIFLILFIFSVFSYLRDPYQSYNISENEKYIFKVSLREL